jgi:DNA transformation protein and related proteins
MRGAATRGDEDENGYVAYVVDLLRGWAPVAARRMFGAHGLFRGDLMFGLVVDDTLYFKTDAINRGDYEAAGMLPFSYARVGRDAVIMSYHAVPSDLLEGDGALIAWAERAYAASLRGRRAKSPARKMTSRAMSRGRD